MQKCYAEISGLVHISHSKTFESCEIFSTVLFFVVVVAFGSVLLPFIPKNRMFLCFQFLMYNVSEGSVSPLFGLFELNEPIFID